MTSVLPNTLSTVFHGIQTTALRNGDYFQAINEKSAPEKFSEVTTQLRCDHVVSCEFLTKGQPVSDAAVQWRCAHPSMILPNIIRFYSFSSKILEIHPSLRQYQMTPP